MKFNIYLERRALKQISNFNKKEVLKIKSAISDLSENPRPFGYIKLKGENAYRIRIGDFRIIYEIIDKEEKVIIITIIHRKDAYK